MSRKIPVDEHRALCKCTFCLTNREVNRFVSRMVYIAYRANRVYATSAKNDIDHPSNIWITV